MNQEYENRIVCSDAALLGTSSSLNMAPSLLSKNASAQWKHIAHTAPGRAKYLRRG